ncbi:uncharacterized protein L3040_003419 [Drepanopeziza brunnea f. sp. 'multigermtubi']|uniref:Uncharacterized protein n=1 Tax=Marssonina brunnea f. sp. multigermtubi (strain MB_m1) TaxID=1072389 RepID=K1WSE6_MARBU|nr:uncharacterized protein MBM_05992 [Drepanopeziza brunnea f. sp. 'multigermtubi' MB_m1]EKD15981.1 hypothetical protein MBM_05992 [Drepanopeziza brunnea f. sp. 'multigermtubi' MB_m1]KAJ5047597.1 hypothetical protein L3040_003419 [Drepanopeziza brunnea f. sp. 'multigermtubi']
MPRFSFRLWKSQKAQAHEEDEEDTSDEECKHFECEAEPEGDDRPRSCTPDDPGAPQIQSAHPAQPAQPANQHDRRPSRQPSTSRLRPQPQPQTQKPAQHRFPKHTQEFVRALNKSIKKTKARDRAMLIEVYTKFLQQVPLEHPAIDDPALFLELARDYFQHGAKTDRKVVVCVVDPMCPPCGVPSGPQFDHQVKVSTSEFELLRSYRQHRREAACECGLELQKKWPGLSMTDKRHRVLRDMEVAERIAEEQEKCALMGERAVAPNKARVDGGGKERIVRERPTMSEWKEQQERNRVEEEEKMRARTMRENAARKVREEAWRREKLEKQRAAEASSSQARIPPHQGQAEAGGDEKPAEIDEQIEGNLRESPRGCLKPGNATSPKQEKSVRLNDGISEHIIAPTTSITSIPRSPSR